MARTPVCESECVAFVRKVLQLPDTHPALTFFMSSITVLSFVMPDMLISGTVPLQSTWVLTLRRLLKHVSVSALIIPWHLSFWLVVGGGGNLRFNLPKEKTVSRVHLNGKWNCSDFQAPGNRQLLSNEVNVGVCTKYLSLPHCNRIIGTPGGQKKNLRVKFWLMFKKKYERRQTFYWSMFIWNLLLKSLCLVL